VVCFLVRTKKGLESVEEEVSSALEKKFEDDVVPSLSLRKKVHATRRENTTTEKKREILGFKA